MVIQKQYRKLDLDRAKGRAMFFIIEEAKQTILEFSQGTMRIL